MKLIKEIKNLKGKKVLVRVDFNVPVGDDGVVDGKEDWRIKAALPTIKYLFKNKAKVILISHLGRPEKKQIFGEKMDDSFCGNDDSDNNKYSLKPVTKRLEELLNCRITFIDDCVGDKVEKEIEKMQASEIIVLENLRFYKEEEENDENFAKEIASFADLYVNDAFSVSHRAHASVCAITKFLPSYAGILLDKEVKILSDAINNPTKPATIIIGGAKAETKLPVIKNLLDKFDHIIVGGVVANVILKTKGIDIGKSLLSGIDSEEAKKIDLTDNRLHIPIDAVVCNSKKKEVNLLAVGNIGYDRILDIGPESRELYSNIIEESKMIIWNGPMGKFENDDFADGTKMVAGAVARSKGYRIIGGGDTITALDRFGYLDKVDYVCTGGGAMLEFLSGKKLPGLMALE